MKCPYCTGTLFTEGDYDLAQVVALQPVLIRNVHAFRCDQCGYLQVSAEVMRHIEEMLAERGPDTVLPAAVYDMTSSLGRPDVASVPPMRVETRNSFVTV